MSDPTWDDFDIDDEVVTEDEAKDIEGGGIIPIGLYLCRCVSSTPKMINFNAYSTMGAKLGFSIVKVLEIQKRPPTDEEVRLLLGKKIFDGVAFQNEKEKEGMAKRRKYVALKLGIITPGEILRKSMWQKDVLDKKVILRVVDGSYKNKDGVLVEKTEVDFFNGYESADSAEAVTEKAEEWEGII